MKSLYRSFVNLSKGDITGKSKLEIQLEKNFQIIQNKPNTENEIIIQKLEEKIKSLEERLLFDSPKNEKLINITIETGDQKIKYSLICKNTDKINDIEKMLYKNGVM